MVPAKLPERDERNGAPQEVELLFDREASSVIERRRSPKTFPIVMARIDRVPVRGVEERGESVRSDARKIGGCRKKD
jgi:hypothetical protein